MKQLITVLLKGKNVRDRVMRWLASCVMGNLDRAKLGQSLVQNAMQNQINNISSDAFCINAIYLFYELCLPFLNVNDDKIKKIDPTYLPSKFRLDFTQETMICSDPEKKKPL